MLDLHAMFYCFLFLNPPTLRGCFLLTLLTVSSLGQDPTSATCISLLMGLSPAILTAPICFPWNHQDRFVKTANGDTSVIKTFMSPMIHRMSFNLPCKARKTPWFSACLPSGLISCYCHTASVSAVLWFPEQPTLLQTSVLNSRKSFFLLLFTQ